MSTIATSILPNRIYNPKLNHSVDISVFSNLSQQKSLVKLVTVATDNASALEYKFSKLGNIVYNLPNLSHDPLLYHQEVINGFEKAYNFILENKESLLTLCENLAMLKIRHLMQSTVIYAQCLRALQHPTFLASLDNYLKYLEKTLGQNVSPLRQFGMASEINALSKFCIPTFWIDNKLFKIQNGYGDEVDIKIKLNSYETIKFILRERLSKQDIYAQKFAILTSFYCARQSASVPKIKSIPELSLFKNLIKVDPVKSIDKHISLLINLFDDVKLEDDQKALIGWATTKYFIDDTCSVSHANLSVYDGLIGISLSYAAVAVSHKSDARDKSLMAIEQCIKFLYDRCTVRNTMLDINSKGFYGSTGGVIYGLAIIDMLLGELPGISKQQIAHVFDHILQRIYKVLLNLESIKTQELDLINGTIGTLLALMRAYQITKNKTFHQYIPINDVLDFVQQLLPVEEYFADKKNLISLAHGGAGILYAHFLVWQFQATHADTYSKFLQLYLINLKDQLDDSSSVQSWCNGLGGVILVLVTIINNDANSARLIRVEILLKLLVQKFLENIDNHNFNLSLCHGVSGDLEVIYQLWQNGMISENQYKTYKIRFEEIIMQENDNNKHQYVMGLFSGYAGIIYQAFRLKNPELIPNILL